MEKKKVAQYIAQERLLEAGGKVIVALSGGAEPNTLPKNVCWKLAAKSSWP